MNPLPPPAIMAKDERNLTKVTLQEERPGLREKLLEEIKDYPGLLLETEVISYTDQHGYIFRYSIASTVKDESGGMVECRALLAICTKDGRTFRGATTSEYDLPGRPGYTGR
jgi:hypothetical protein